MHRYVQVFENLPVLVIGEAILDRYSVGTARRTCTESAAPIVDVCEEQAAPGGAANTACNLAALGARVCFLTAVGEDAAAGQLRQLLGEAGVQAHLLAVAGRETLVKHRLVADGQILARFDRGSTAALPSEPVQHLLALLEAEWGRCRAVVVSDYRYGILGDPVIAALAGLQQRTSRTLVVDARDLTRYRKVGVSAVKPNYEEALGLLDNVQTAASRLETVTACRGQLLERTGASSVIVSLDREGVVLLERKGPARHIESTSQPGPNGPPYAHTTGAGDTFVAALALALAAGEKAEAAARLAQKAAGVVVARSGTARCSAADLEAELAWSQKQPKASPVTGWSAAQNILCVRLDAMGDVLMSTPALRALRRPDRRLTLLTSSAGGQIARLIPEVDEVIVYDAPWLKATAPRATSRPEYEMAAYLRQRQFDAAAIFTVFSQNPLPSAMLCYLAGIPLRLAHCHENPYQLLTNWILDPEPAQGIRHEVRRQLDLVATIGAYSPDERLSVRAGEKAHRQVQQLLAELGIGDGRPWLVIHPGATAPSRRYAPEGFAAVAERLVAEEGYTVLFTGNREEAGLIEQIRSKMVVPSFSLAGRLDLEELVALIAMAPLLVANNTGPVHIAAATGTPVVDLYALTNPQHTPWEVPHRVLSHDVPCKFCFKSLCPEGHNHCLQLVTPEQVLTAVRELSQYEHRRYFDPHLLPSRCSGGDAHQPDRSEFQRL
ncbi:lipopolysaccharide heptosyltransferase II [Gloeobacter kilaueensis]|uniref:lipopolysaccharide heptosyltransferase II n=1 Tax=Gloeobacter kilaueensis (strain ATCC BAA-2537 / CCAP 1431/1 / ULC 316 / JS1) TaxID=1183438 RepID=U5QE94_GLOK1|nr:lipopolysaccharide heptosyltransferase II [Gloeobacter kilaueensis]AGY57193.1 heptosyltransferase family protein [Gloeobacter kilaueensis JS1]